jgi:SEC-C motif
LPQEKTIFWLYLQKLNDEGEHDFVLQEDFDHITITEGFWEGFLHNPQHLAQIEANKPSYFWDQLIERFSKYIIDDTQYYTSHHGAKHSEQILRFMAREHRTRRRLLAKSLLEFVQKTPADFKAVRVVQPSKPGDPFYVFVLLPSQHAKTREEYREVRYKLLESYCLVTKRVNPDALDIIGISTDSEDPGSTGEDALYLDARGWTAELEAEAKSLQEDLGLLTNVTMFSGNEEEYPDIDSLEEMKPSMQTLMKGRDRNKPCPCGSGKKYKYCCGKR